MIIAHKFILQGLCLNSLLLFLEQRELRGEKRFSQVKHRFVQPKPSLLLSTPAYMVPPLTVSSSESSVHSNTTGRTQIPFLTLEDPRKKT